MKVLVTGADGSVGARLVSELTARGHQATGTDITDADITDLTSILRRVDAVQPDLVIHCAALTDVDLCARQPDLALRVNGMGTQNVALAAQRIGAALCYISTNEVFDGERGTPYLEYDTPHPINPYGYSKWVGEQVVRELVPRHFTVRTSWLFAHGRQNFLHRIVDRATAGQPLSVVCNEVACPTYGEDLVAALTQLVETERYGVYHLVNEGSTSRYDFARCVLDCYGFHDTPIAKVISAQYPRASRPPTYSALRNFAADQIGIRLRPWQDAVAAFVERERSLA